MHSLRPFARILVLFLALLPLGACASSGSREPAHHHTLVFLKSGDQAGKRSQPEQIAMFAGHMQNIQKLAREKKLLVAGPFGQPRSDATLRGVFVFATDDVADARVLADADPGVKAGEFRAEVHAFATDTDLRPQLERALAAEDRAQAEGQSAKPQDFIRAYTLLIVDDGDAAWSGLRDLEERGSVVLLGRLDEKRALAVLDAADRKAAEALLAPVAMQLGTFSLEPWWASRELAAARVPAP